MLAEQVEGLGHQLTDTGLAIGAGDPHQIQLPARFAIEAPGDFRQLCRQPLDRNQRHISDRQYGGAISLIGDRRRSALQRIGDMLTAIDLATRYRQEQITGTHFPAVERQLANQQFAACVGEYLVQTQGH